ncbi:MAG TPA: aldehyde dehydrogenase family protein [Sphaerochaeta sp.]|nr:aldehyde dehydrogenase family protein [Sphaerochaeta sp.]
MDAAAPLRQFAESGVPREIEFRLQMLKRLQSALVVREAEILSALTTDLGKSSFEGFFSEVGLVYKELSYHIAHLKRWARPKRVRPSLLSFPSRSYTISRPLGTVLIISPWNYPFQLTLIPLISAMAAGNTIMLKPSTKSSATTALLTDLITSLFDPSYIAISVDRSVVSGSWDHIFFTGSPAVGKMIMRQASEHLTPVTLELGGKSPVIVEAASDLRLAARRIVWAKALNSGQTCVAPDYVLVETSALEPLIAAMSEEIERMYGSDMLSNADYPAIIDQSSFERLVSQLREGTVRYGGSFDPERRKIALALLTDVPLTATVMQEEIFGPILPIIAYETLDEAFAFVASRPTPLAAYLFSKKRAHQRRFVRELAFGGGCINDLIVHLSNLHLPFGGQGPSGMGSYHGKQGFLTFSHTKSITHSATALDIPVRYAPFPDKLSLLKKLFR